MSAATGQAARLITTLQMLFYLAFIGVTVRVFTTAARHRAQQQR